MTFPCEPLVLHLFWRLLLAAAHEHLAHTAGRRGGKGQALAFWGSTFTSWQQMKDELTSPMQLCITVPSFPQGWGGMQAQGQAAAHPPALFPQLSPSPAAVTRPFLANNQAP